MNSKATLVKNVEREVNSSNGPASLYRLDPPKGDVEHVFVSTARVVGAWETYAFRADANGDVLSWSELYGSMKRYASHEEVLREMGYELVGSESVKA